MKIKLLRNTLIKGQHTAAGSIIDVDDALGRELIVIKKAAPTDEVEIRDPKLKKSGASQ